MRLMVKQSRRGRPVPAPGTGQQKTPREPGLADDLAGLDPGWTVIRGCELPSVRPGQSAVHIPFALVHRDLGVVLLEFEPASTDDAVQRLRMLLLANGGAALEPDRVPVLHLRVARDKADRLGLALSHALQCRRGGGGPADDTWMSPVLETLRASAVRRAAPAPPPLAFAQGARPAMGGRIWAAALLCLGGGVALVQLLPSPSAYGPLGLPEERADVAVSDAPTQVARPAPVVAALAPRAGDALPAARPDAFLPAPAGAAAPAGGSAVPGAAPASAASDEAVGPDVAGAPPPPAAIAEPAAALAALVVEVVPDRWSLAETAPGATPSPPDPAPAEPAADALPEAEGALPEELLQAGAAPPIGAQAERMAFAAPPDPADDLPPTVAMLPEDAAPRPVRGSRSDHASLPEPVIAGVSEPEPVADASWQVGGEVAVLAATASEIAADALPEPEPFGLEAGWQSADIVPMAPAADAAPTPEPTMLPDAESLAAGDASMREDVAPPPLPAAAPIAPQPEPDPAAVADAAWQVGEGVAFAAAIPPEPGADAAWEPAAAAPPADAWQAGEAAPIPPAASAGPERAPQPVAEAEGPAAAVVPRVAAPEEAPAPEGPAVPAAEPPSAPVPAVAAMADSPPAAAARDEAQDTSVPPAGARAAPAPAPPAEPASEPPVAMGSAGAARTPQTTPNLVAGDAPAPAVAQPGDEVVPQTSAAPEGTAEAPSPVAPDALAAEGGERSGLDAREAAPGASVPSAPGGQPPPPVVQAPSAPPAAKPLSGKDPTATAGPAPVPRSAPPQPEPETPSGGTPPVAAPAPAMAPALVTALIRRGDAMLALGDVSAARLLYERAAAGGSGAAALAAGRTYDPRMLESIGARSLRPDPEAAARWYRRALELGEGEAEPLLRAIVAGRGN